MQRRLILVRHAKAADGPVDRDRVLAPRGERDAESIGAWLETTGNVPDLVIVSPARRTRQTWQRAATRIETEPRVSDDERIYDNRVEDLLAVVNETEPDVQTLALVGHNPSMHGLAVLLDDGAGHRHVRIALDEGYPTAAVAMFAVAGWDSVGAGSARLLASAVCRAG